MRHASGADSEAAANSEADAAVQETILDLVTDGTVLVGTLRTLADGLGVSTSGLRSGLRALLEAGRIAVHTQPGGQLTVRLERRRSSAPPPLPPDPDRRRPRADIWVL